VLKAASASATPEDIIDALQLSGVPVTDPRNGQVTPRLSLHAAALQLTNVGTPQPGDVTPPTGTVRINGGAAWTRARDVRVSVLGRDSSGIGEMCVSASAVAPCAPWEPYATSKAWSLADGDGPKTVYVFLKDKAGNAMTNPVSASITLDRAPPTGAAVTINGGAAWTTSRLVTLGIAGSDPAGLQMCLGNAAASDCTAYEAFAASKAWYLASGPDGPRTVYLWLRDGAGNAVASPASATISVDATPPVVTSLTINGGAPWTASRTVSLAVAGSDASGVAAMCVKSSSLQCADAEWVPFASPVSITLPDGAEGARTVYVRLRDARGNAMASAATASITYDASPPSAVSVTVVKDNAPSGTPTSTSGAGAGAGAGAAGWVTTPSVTLGIAATDASGVAGMCLSEDGGAPCTDFVPFAARATWDLTKGADGARTVYVTLRDGRGNTMPTPASVALKSDLRPPSDCRVEVAGGAATTRWRSVKLGLSATDPAGVVNVCLTADAAEDASNCSPWLKYSESRRFTLPAGRGQKIVRAFFRDANGHVTPEPAAISILYDPDGPDLTAAAAQLAAAPLGGDSVRVTWNAAAASDGGGGSGVAGYMLVFRPGAAPLRCRNPRDKRVEAVQGVQVSAATGQGSATVSGLKPGRRYGFRLCASDAAGNISNGLTVTARTARAKRAGATPAAAAPAAAAGA
jgi:hypothetical protein